nr:rh5-interacting protein-like isoform X1 [Megalopta genalis]
MHAVNEPGRSCVLLLAAAILSLAAAAAAAVAVQPIDVNIPCNTKDDCIGFSPALKNATCTNGFCLCTVAGVTRNCSNMDIQRPTNRNAGLPLHPCKGNQDCMFQNSICNTQTSRCECQKDYVWSDNRKFCLRKAEAIDFACEEDKQCTAFLANTTCRDGKCGCIDGYHYKGNLCHKTIALNNTCTRLEECGMVAGAICTDRRLCECMAGTVINAAGNMCLTVAKEFLYSCVEDQQCSVTFENTVCVDEACRCLDQYHFDQGMNRCFVDRGLDENCATTQECYHASKANGTQSVGLLCLKNVCVCAEDYYRDGDACIANEGARWPGPSALVLAALVLPGLLRGI